MDKIKLYEKIPLLENRFTVSCVEYKGKNRFQPHWHEHIELLYFFSGSGQLTCDGNIYPVNSGDLAVVNSTEIHSFISSHSNRYICILVYPDFFSDVDFDKKAIIENVIRNDQYIKEIFEKIVGYIKQKKTSGDMLLKGSVYYLMAYLVDNYVATNLTQEDAILKAKRLKRINTVLEYISENYQKKITTQDLAKLCFVTEAHFCRFFKESIGKSAVEYVNEFRIEKALVLLKETEESITDIAFEVGFSDSNYFSRTFKKIKNKTPLEYRKGQRVMEK